MECYGICLKIDTLNRQMDKIEQNDEFTARLILKGEWLYDNLVPMTVQIFAINYDYYFELDRGYNEEGEVPQLNEKGEQYIIAWHGDKFYSTFQNISFGGLTLDEAIHTAENTLRQKVNWVKC